jgi:hypothetical protein
MRSEKNSIPNKDLTLISRLFSAIVATVKSFLFKIDAKVDGAISFFFKHYGKSKFMLAMSKKAQVIGLENLFLKGPKAFFYFFMFYLIRDTILYIIIPIFFASITSGN